MNARPHFKRPFVPVHAKKEHLIFKQMLSEKFIIDAFKHLIGLKRLDEVRLRLLQSIKYDDCPQDKNQPDKGLSAFVPYRIRIKQKEINSDVVLSSDMALKPLSDSKRVLNSFKSSQLSVHNIIELMRKFYGSKKINLTREKTLPEIVNPKNMKSSLHGGIKLGNKAKLPVIVMRLSGNLKIEHEDLKGWVIIRNSVVYINLKGASFPLDIEFSGKGDVLATKLYTWDYESKKIVTYDKGYDYWGTDNSTWSKSTALWTSKNKINYKKPNLKKIGIIDGSKTSDKNTSLLY